MILLIYVLGVVLFLTALRLTRMIHSGVLAVRRSLLAARILTDPRVDDFDKEREARAASLEMLMLAINVLVKAVVVVAMTASPFWLADIFGIESWERTKSFALRLDVTVCTSTLVLVGLLLRRRRLRAISGGNHR